ncbi:hypothetical protein RUND412_008877 [Rhizina undulata]
MPSKDENAEFAKAYKELVDAEKHAATLESQLSSLEQKLDAFLAEHGVEAADEKDDSSPRSSRGDSSTSKPSGHNEI